MSHIPRRALAITALATASLPATVLACGNAMLSPQPQDPWFLITMCLFFGSLLALGLSTCSYGVLRLLRWRNPDTYGTEGIGENIDRLLMVMGTSLFHIIGCIGAAMIMDEQINGVLLVLGVVALIAGGLAKRKDSPHATKLFYAGLFSLGFFALNHIFVDPPSAQSKFGPAPHNIEQEVEF